MGGLASEAAMRRRLADVLGFAERGVGARGGVGGGGRDGSAGMGSAAVEGSTSGRTKPKDMSSTMWRLGRTGLAMV